MRKKEDIRDYCMASEAAQILSVTHGRTIRPDYVSKMVKTAKHRIRVVLFHDRQLYHRSDIQACCILSHAAKGSRYKE